MNLLGMDEDCPTASTARFPPLTPRSDEGSYLNRFSERERESTSNKPLLTASSCFRRPTDYTHCAGERSDPNTKLETTRRHIWVQTKKLVH